MPTSYPSPIEIDSTCTIEGRFSIYYFEWHPTAANQDILVRDSLDNLLWMVRAPIGSDNSIAYSILSKQINIEQVNGIVVEVLDGGTLYVYLQ